jgi:VIT1/CCC1 family predicted Fe2+/Mn2+ transporter
MFRRIHEDYFRSIVFGFQDALVSTTGVIVGVATGTGNVDIVIMAGIITILVESLSMGVGQYMSEKAVHQMDKSGKHTDNLYVGGALMMLSYFLGGLVPLTPMLFFPITTAISITILASLLGLFILGFLKAKIVRVDPLKSAVEITILGGIATAIGIVAGNFLRV